ncbi:hypothetical protein [Peribacillus asahii]
MNKKQALFDLLNALLEAERAGVQTANYLLENTNQKSWTLNINK